MTSLARYNKSVEERDERISAESQSVESFVFPGTKRRAASMTLARLAESLP